MYNSSPRFAAFVGCGCAGGACADAWEQGAHQAPSKLKTITRFLG